MKQFLTVKTLFLCFIVFICTDIKSQNDTLIKLTPTIYEIGGLGGNVTLKITEKGIVLIDAGTSLEAGKRILQIIAGVSKKPVTHIILTHYHYDHTRGLEAFSDDVEILSHSNVLASLKKDELKIQKDILENIPSRIKKLKDDRALLKADDIKERSKIDSTLKAETENLELLKKIRIIYPDRTYEKENLLVFENDSILLIHPGNAHTNGDTWVLFKNDNIATLGDLLFTNCMPYIDVDEGANTLNWIKTLDYLAEKNYNYYISGHSNLANPSDIKRFTSYLTDLRFSIGNEINKGKSLEEIKKQINLTDYQDFGFQFFKEQNIEAVYKELVKK